MGAHSGMAQVIALSPQGDGSASPRKQVEEEDAAADEGNPLTCAKAMMIIFFIVVIIPLIVIVISAVFGAMLADAEGWTFEDGFYYVVGNLVGLATPLTDVSPTSEGGKVLDVFVAVWSLSLAGVAIGFIGSFSFVGAIAEKIEGREFTDNTEINKGVIQCNEQLKGLKHQFERILDGLECQMLGESAAEPTDEELE